MENITSIALQVITGLVSASVTLLAGYGAYKKIKAEADKMKSESQKTSAEADNLRAAGQIDITERLNRVAAEMTEKMQRQVNSLHEELNKEKEKIEKRGVELEELKGLFMECHELNNSMLSGIISSINAIEFYIQKRDNIIGADQKQCYACIEADSALLRVLAEMKERYLRDREEMEKTSTEIRNRIIGDKGDKK